MSDPSAMADAAGYASYLSLDHKWELLENPDVESRLEALNGWTRYNLAEAEITDKSGEAVREGMETSQRALLMRPQLTVIRKARGEVEHDGAAAYRGGVEASDLTDVVLQDLHRV